MNDLLVLVKLLTSVYQAKKLKDKNLLTELTEILEELPAPPPDILTQDKALREGIRSAIFWTLDQEDGDPLIKSLLMQRIAVFSKGDDTIKKVVADGMEDFDSEEMIRRLIFRQIKDIRKNAQEEAFQKRFRQKIRDFAYKDLHEMKREDWGALLDLIQERVNESFNERQSEVVVSVNSNDTTNMLAVIELAKREKSPEGILKSPLHGLNIAMYPDGGFNRNKTYMIEALTNRGKSLTMGHILWGIAKYNTPFLRDPSKIPTICFDSSEDTMGLVLERMYKLTCAAALDNNADFLADDAGNIADEIAKCFRENGWFLVMNQIESNKEDMNRLFDRVRTLELKGHEIIFYGYDYLALMNYDKIPGDSKSDKLQLLYRRVRSFMINRGICFVTPHQLNPDAKRSLKEMDDESEVYFIRDTAGQSMTETSTKITNEVDCVLGIHVARGQQASYWCCMLGKMRGEGAPPPDRFFFYRLDPKFGLLHDILGKPMFRRSLQQRITSKGLENSDDMM